MPENFLIVPTSDVTSGRIDTLQNARHATDQTPVVGGLTNGQEVVVYRLSDGITGMPAPSPALRGLFTVSFGDGRLDILSHTLNEPANFTVAPGDASLTVLPAEET